MGQMQLHPLSWYCAVRKGAMQNMDQKKILSVGCLMLGIMMVIGSFMPVSMSGTAVQNVTVRMVYNISPGVMNAMGGDGFNVVETYDAFSIIEMTDEKANLLENYGYEVKHMPERTMISVPGYYFDTRNGAPSVPQELKAKESAPGDIGLYIVQMIGPVKNEWFDSMVRAGAEPIVDVSNYAYEVRMTPEVAKAVGALDCVSWMGIYEPAYKISPVLTGYDVIITMIGSDIPADSLNHVRGRMSVEKEGTIPDGYIFYGSIVSQSAMEEIAASPYVQYIEPNIIPELHDEMGMQITGGFAWLNDPDGNINTPYRTLGTHGSYANQLGWDGTGVIVGIADSGLGNGATPNAGHNDFTGRVIGGIDLGATVNGWQDEHGHGTHCAGLMAGDTYEGNGLIYAGAAKYYVAMGQAHEAQIFGQQIFEGASASADIPADYTVILSTAYTAGARVHSNSWGSNTAGAYSAADVGYDTAARDSSTNADRKSVV